MERVETPTFLFVDQDPLWLAALRRTSRDLPVLKHFARSAEEALKLIHEHTPAVVVSSYRLPEVDGLSLLEQVHQQYPRVACVLHTTYSPRLLRSAPGIALVEKDAPPGTLRAVLRALFVALTGQTPAPSGSEPAGP